MTFVSNLLISHQVWFRLVGGCFLCYLGLKTFLARPAEHAAAASGNGLLGAYVSTFFLTLTNPLTILFFAAIFAGLGAGWGSATYVSAVLLVIGVFSGSALWWLVLSAGVGVIRTKFTPQRMLWVNRISGVVITGFGVLALLSLR